MANLTIAKIRNIRQPLDLGELHPDLSGQTVDVWLNPTVEFKRRWAAHVDLNNDLVKKLRQLADRLGDEDDASQELQEEWDALMQTQAHILDGWYDLYAELWDISAEDIRTLAKEAPPVYQWLVDRSAEIREEWSAGKLAKAKSG